MTLKEAAQLLFVRIDYLEELITKGVLTHGAEETIKLKATKVGRSYEVTDADLDDLIEKLHAHEPKKKIPVSARREVLTEANHTCAICRKEPAQEIHHIIEQNEVGHNDPAHMLAVCGTCHNKCTKGEIDTKSQYMYKKKLARERETSAVGINSDSLEDMRFSWDDLRDVIDVVHKALAIKNPKSDSQWDFVALDIEKKNRINKLGDDYFERMRTEHEPLFGRIQRFLESPANDAARQLYHEIVGELALKIAALQHRAEAFEQILLALYDSAIQSNASGLKGKKATLRILLSYMYFNCDIGRKT